MLGCACDAKEAESVGSSTGLGIHVWRGSDIRESFGLEKTLVTSTCETFVLSGFETFVPRCVTIVFLGGTVPLLLPFSKIEICSQAVLLM